MASTDVPRVLIEQYSDSLATLDNSHSSDPILAKFKKIREKLEADSTALTNPESISWLSDLNDALADWRILKEQNNPIKRIFSMNEWSAINTELDNINTKLDDLKKLVKDTPSSSTGSSQPNLLKLDRYTFYKPDQKDQVSDECEKRMVDWLLKSVDDFKAVGICGMGGSGKTSLVKNVLKQKAVGDKFKLIIWACLSELTCEEDIDKWIMEYLLYRLGLDTDSLGLDTDSLEDDVEENKNWLMKEVELRLKKSRNYILVLDDMWYCSKWFADEFLGKLLKKIGGGVVIVTSQRKTVAETIGEKNMLIRLDPLDYKESAFFKTKEYLGN